MDSNTSRNPLPSTANSKKTTRYYHESNTEPLIVHSSNPFNNFLSKTNVKKIRSDNEFIDIFDQTPKNEPIRFSVPSNALMNNIINGSNTLKNSILYSSPYDKEAYIMQPDTTNHSMNLDPRNCVTNYSRNFCMKKESVTLDNNYGNYTNSSLISNNVSERCNDGQGSKKRPAMNTYNKEYVYKTMNKNARLQKFVKKLVAVREKEKRRETWNNYINDLKNKHKYYSNEPTKILPQYVPDEPTNVYIVDDTCNSRLSWKPTHLCQDVLYDVYENNTDIYPKVEYEYPKTEFSPIPHPQYPNPYASQQFCYPTSSQSRIIILNREKERQENEKSCCSSRFRNRGIIVVEKDSEDGCCHNEYFEPDKYCKSKWFNLKKNVEIPSNDNSALPLVNEEENSSSNEDTDQPSDDDDDQLEVKKKERKGGFREKLRRLTGRTLLSKKRTTFDDNIKVVTPESLEGKIDKLIDTLNMFIKEVRQAKNLPRDIRSVSVRCSSSKDSCYNHNKTNTNNGMQPRGFRQVMQTSSKLTYSDIASSGYRGRETLQRKINKIKDLFSEEFELTDKMKKDIEVLLDERSRGLSSVEVTIDIPTKGRSDATLFSSSKGRTASVGDFITSHSSGVRTYDDYFDDKSDRFSRTSKSTTVVPEKGPSNDFVKEYFQENQKQNNMAFNSDPLGLSTLIRMTADGLKQVLSYMPYLNMPLPQLPLLPQGPQKIMSYVCNFCGASFKQPSQLNDHIQQHELGKTRDCSICRDTLDSRPLGHFVCQYCGQRFTRAYCCELHQYSCAKHFGKSHDVSSSKMLLK